jgi:predicted metal-dependent HD superfamily phosphohydrolase
MTAPGPSPHDLPSAWLRDARAVEARGDVAGAGARLLGRWAEPHRGYHDLTHLAEVLARIEDLSSYALDPATVRLGAWFHDAHYDPAAADNEERSAAYADEVLRSLHVAPGVAAEVTRLVRLTATHDPDDGDRDGAVLCDADLAVLAADAERYGEYAAGVRREYAHVDDAAFAAGRTDVLSRLVARDWLFRTEHARVRWEAAARANVAAELSRLCGT